MQGLNWKSRESKQQLKFNLFINICIIIGMYSVYMQNIALQYYTVYLLQIQLNSGENFLTYM